MTKKPYARKALAMLLSVTLLLSCMVWTGVSAEETVYTTDFTGYTVTAKTDMSATASTKAQVVATGDATHGEAMQLSFLGTNGMKQAGFRFFANKSEKVAVAKGTIVMVQFAYKVSSLSSDAELRVIAGSWPWTGGPNNETGTYNTPSDHCAVAASLPATSAAGEWQTAQVLVKAVCSSAGIHIYLDSATPGVGDTVLIDDVKLIVNYTPIAVTLDYGYDSKTETLLGIGNTSVPLPTPTRSAHVFKGWNTKADGTGDYVTDAVYTENVTYYAVWEVDSDKAVIKFETNGGAAVGDLYGEQGAAATLPTPTKGVYTFEGWYTDAALTVKAENVTFPATAGGSLTLYAKWSDPAPLAASSAPVGKLLGKQTFEVDALADIDLQKFNSIVTETSYQGSKSLKTTVKSGFNSQRSRPRIVVKNDGGANIKVEAGKTYKVSFWVRSAKTNSTFTFYAATMGASDVDAMIAATSGSCHTLQTITATVGNATAALNGNRNEANNCTLEADQWTQVVITIPSLTLDDANDDNYLSIGCTYAAAGSAFNCDMYIDNIELYECRTVTVSFDTAGGDPLDPITSETGTVNLPEPYKFGYTYTGWYEDAALTKPVTSPYSPEADTQTLYTFWKKSAPEQVTLTQDFEDTTSIEEFKTNTTKPFTLATDKSAGTGKKALKSSLKYGFNGNFARPIWAFQMNGQTAPLQVVPGTAATVTFKVMASRDTGKIGYMLDTVNDLSSITKNLSSTPANEFRTMQVLSSSSVGTLNSAKNEVQNISLTAGQWTTITAEIPSITAHGGGAQYLVLAITDTNSSSPDFVGFDLYVDDVEITTYVGGHTTNVTYNTMGGNAMEGGPGIVWMDIAVEPTREGYDFDGWYTDESCSTAITAYPCQEAVTLYAGWRPAGADVMTFEVRDDYDPEVYAHTDLGQTKVQEYYTGNANNWYTGAAATHSLVDVDNVKAMKVVYGGGANTTSMLYGFRLVKADGSAFTTTPGETYSVSFKYKAEALPNDTYATIIEASIPWGTGVANEKLGYQDFDGTLISTTDVGGGWKQATVNFVSENANGIHLALRASDMAKREGTVIYFADIKVQSYQLSKFTTSDGAARVIGEQNYTADGESAVKVDTATTGRVVYASGLGEKIFPTNTINTATVWLYAAEDTDVTLTAYSDPDLTKRNESAHDMGEKAVSLKGKKWTRVQMEFGLTAVTGEAASYISLGVSSASGATVYMDDVSVGTYPNDSTKTQGYEAFEAKTYENTSRLDGTIHGLNGTTVVSGKGHDSEQSLQITMNTEVEADVSRTVLMLDKMDATGTVGSSYIITFYAMAEEDVDVTFALGTTGRIDVSERDMYATTAEAGASKTVSLTAGEWTPISVEVSDLQGKNPEMTVNPYLTLAAWFAGAAADNAKAVYIDDVTMMDYIAPTITREDILCFENTDAFGFGKNINLSNTGKMEVVLDQNHTAGGYYAVKVTNSSIAGGDRPQFNLMNANGEAIKVEKGKTYRVSFWVYVDEVKATDKVRWWLSITDSTDPYTTTDQKNAEVVYEPQDGTAVTKGGWTQIAATLEEVERSGYLRLGISGFTAGEETVFYLDDLRATEYKVFELTGNETVWDFETYNPDDKDFIRKGTGGVSDEINHTDKGLNSMKLVGVGWSGANRNQFIIINPATKQPYEFVKGDSYTVTYWMYYSSATGLADFQMNAWVLGVDDVNEVIDGTEKSDMNGKFEWDGGLIPVTNDGTLVPDAWNQFEITFTATNGKYMLVGMTNGAIQTGGYTYFLDDIEIRKPTPAVVTFDANGGAFDDADKEALNDKGQYVERTAVGLFVTGPSISPYLSGKRFMGWALDPEGQEFFDTLTTTIDKTELTLYAMWGDWPEEDDYDKIDKGNLTDKEEIKYRTEIHSEKVWTGNAQIPVLDFDDDFALDDADPVTYIPNQDADPDPVVDGLPAWLIIVIIVAAVVVIGGGAVLALLLLKNKKSNDEKEGNA